MPEESIDLRLRQEEAYEAICEGARAMLTRDREMSSRQIWYPLSNFNEWSSRVFFFPPVLPSIQPHEIEKKALEEIAEGLAKFGAQGRIPLHYSDAAMRLLKNGINRHSSEAVLSEILGFYGKLKALTPEQHNEYMQHVALCSQCLDTDNGIDMLLPHYELELGRKITQFPLKTIEKFHETCAGIIIDEFVHRNIEVLGAAPYLLNITRDNHVGKVEELAVIMLTMATSSEGLSERMTRAYNRHYDNCPQCQLGMKNLDYGAPPDFPRLVERKQ